MSIELKAEREDLARCISELENFIYVRDSCILFPLTKVRRKVLLRKLALMGEKLERLDAQLQELES